MDKNIIYYFSGTGNSLKAAKDIAAALGNCDVVSMGVPNAHDTRNAYQSVGIVFPVYGSGLPRRVEKFITGMDLSKSKVAYFYAVATCGAMEGSALGKLSEILTEKGVTLQYADILKTAANYVCLYPMSKDNNRIAADANAALKRIADEIKSRMQKPVPTRVFVFKVIHAIFAHRIANKDTGFRVSSACVGCGICKTVCPVENIAQISGDKPEFRHHCEQCMACIQWCPNQAINYKNKTQNRGRYHHPEIQYQELNQNIHID